MRNASVKSCIWMALLLMPLVAYAKKYSAEPITTYVVDADTQEPIEGVVVVAAWVLEGGLEGGNFKGVMMVMETVTDQSGAFHFAGWGPKSKPSYIRWVDDARLKSYAPQFFLFKSGYRIGEFANQSTEAEEHDPSTHTSDWNRKAIPLKKFAGNFEQYAKDLNSWSVGLRSTMEPRCTWAQIPLMIKALGRQTRIFRAANIYVGTFYDDLVSNEEYRARDGCSVKAFLQEHGE